MSVFNRIKNIGESNLSESLTPGFFRMDDLARYGFRGGLTAKAWDPVQGLMAIGTNNGYIHVFGQKNVEYVFSLKQNLSVDYLCIVKSVYLVVIDSAHTVSVFSLDTKDQLSVQTIPGRVSAIASDPAMDWLFIGLETGMISVYDVDRGVLSPYNIGNLQKSFLPKARLSPIISLQIHPRDPSKLLVCYTESAIVFNLITQEIIFGLRYELQPGAPGGDTVPSIVGQFRAPPMLQALWHPHGHHILTVHFDGSLVFWDGTEGTLLQARTLTDNDVNIPRRGVSAMHQAAMGEGLDKTPISQVSWVSTQNPEETAIIVAGGHSYEGAVQGLTMLDFGVTPNVAITSYQNMGKHYASPRRNRVFPLPPGQRVVDFIVLPKVNPYYGGGFDPNLIIIQLASGEMCTLKFPEGLPLDTVAGLPSAFGWVQPYITTLAVGSVKHAQWLGMMTSVPAVESYFIGGAQAKRHLRKFDIRNALCTGHTNGSVRLWDSSHGELDDSRVLEVNVAETLRRHGGCEVTNISFAPNAAELAIAIETGEVAIYRFGHSRGVSDQMRSLNLADNDQPLQDIRSRSTVKKDGFIPQTLVNTNNGPVSAVVCSEIQFVAIGYKNGSITVIDERGPAIIYSGLISQLTIKKSKLLSHRSQSVGSVGEYATAMEFAIYMLDGEKFSSIVLAVGTNVGKVHSFRVMPSNQGRYSLEYLGYCDAGDQPILEIMPINMVTGKSARATMEEMNGLPRGIQIHGAIVTVSKSECKVIRQPKSKLASRSFSSPVATGGICFMLQNNTLCLTVVTVRGEIIIYSLPYLQEIIVNKLPFTASPETIGDSIVMQNGDIIIRRNKLSAALINIWGRGINYDDIPADALYDVMKPLPPRPTISTMQWIKGTPVATIQDVDAIVGGTRRPKSKETIERERAQREQQLLIQRQGGVQQPARPQTNSAFKTISNALDSFEETTNNYLNTLSESIKDVEPSQSSLMKGAFKARFF